LSQHDFEAVVMTLLRDLMLAGLGQSGRELATK
jgi:hypothetical protein